MRVGEGRRHGAARDPHDPGDLDLREIADVPQHDGGALAGWELVDDRPGLAGRRGNGRGRRPAGQQPSLEGSPAATPVGDVHRDPVGVRGRGLHPTDPRPAGQGSSTGFVDGFPGELGVARCQQQRRDQARVLELVPPLEVELVAGHHSIKSQAGSFCRVRGAGQAVMLAVIGVANGPSSPPGGGFGEPKTRTLPAMGPGEKGPEDRSSVTTTVHECPTARWFQVITPPLNWPQVNCGEVRSRPKCESPATKTVGPPDARGRAVARDRHDDARGCGRRHAPGHVAERDRVRAHRVVLNRCRVGWRRRRWGRRRLDAARQHDGAEREDRDRAETDVCSPAGGAPALLHPKILGRPRVAG